MPLFFCEKIFERRENDRIKNIFFLTFSGWKVFTKFGKLIVFAKLATRCGWFFTQICIIASQNNIGLASVNTNLIKEGSTENSLWKSCLSNCNIIKKPKNKNKNK
jgi:hypothetical protein